MTVPILTADRAARARALDPTTSFIVQAPAGSGKTELLIQRFLALLAHVTAPEEVVAITFTIKAAAEMRTRVIEALEAAAADRVPESEHRRRTLGLARAVLRLDAARQWGVAANPARLRIQTIDALCLSLTAQMPLLSRVGAAPIPLEHADALYVEAARETLALLEEPDRTEQVAALLRHLDNDTGRAEALLAGLLMRRDQWLRQHGRLERAALTRALANLVSERLERARAAFPGEHVGELLFCARHAATHSGFSPSGSPLLQLTALTDLPPAMPEHLLSWKGIAQLLLTANDAVRVRVDVRDGFPSPTDRGIGRAEREVRKQAKDRMEALLVRLKSVPGFLGALADARHLPAPIYDDEHWMLIEALTPLLTLAVAQLEVVFQARGVVDFPQLLIAANRALGDPNAPTDLALALDYRIRHLLVDEFQDTSVSQYELLRRLTAGWESGDGRTVFAVGDPMQSIYRFREADVGLFLSARREGIGDVVLEPLVLALNFRSQAGLVAWVNKVFARVLPEREDLATGAIAFAPSIAERAELAGVSVELHPLAANDGKSEARTVVALVQASQLENPAHTVAILVRTRGHLRRIIPALKAARLAFRAVEIEALLQRPAVQDLHALARALLHLADRAAWLALLRAPWCGLTLLDLEALVDDAQEGVLWARMVDSETRSQLSPDGQQRLLRVVEAVGSAMQERARGSLRRRVEAAWLRLGGPASVQEPADLDDAQVYLDRLASLEAGGDLTDLAALEAELDHLYVLPDAHAPETLQVMTIHKAKGLEFDTVILPGLGEGTAHDDPQLLRWLERPGARGESELLLAAIAANGCSEDPIYACISRLLEEREQHEDARVLYVAATRARNRMHLVAEIKLDRTKADANRLAAPSRDAPLAKLWPVLRDELEEELASGTSFGRPEYSGSVPPDPMAYPLRRFNADWKLPPLPAAVAWRSLEVEQGAERAGQARAAAVEFSWASETARHVGTVVHALLQRIGEEGVEAWNVARVGALDAIVRSALKQQGVTASLLDKAQSRVQLALAGVLQDPRGRWILSSAHREAQSEFRLAGELDGVFVDVALDRTFVDENNVRWIVDYKTGAHQGADLERFLDTEGERYRSQLDRYATVLSRLESRPLRVALYFPLVRGWREWEPSLRMPLG